MDTSKLRKFASFARSALIEQVGTRLKTVLAEKSLARRESPKVVEELEKKIKDLGERRLLETVAYTWFNRFCALRYMDVNRYTRIGVLSPADGQFQPEILAEAKMGHIDEELVPEATRKHVMRLLDGSDKSADPQGEAYRLLLVAVCNYYHSLMPFMFEKIADYTELLLPDDLLSGTSLPAYTREALLPINSLPQYIEDFKESVEVIGWLYQFYVADKKDEVFDGLKKGAKITPENIPAATQLFTPHWIVRYLVENSLGRLWMLNHPDSKLVERMDYYIKPYAAETDFLRITSPLEIKVCDPACGSGHMLTYTFDLLYEIYREEQYPEPEIPSLILKNNLYGIEIDPRAGALAAFALTMKAREKDKRFFTRKPQPDASGEDSFSIENSKSRIQNPNICVLENINIDSEDLSVYMDKVGRDLFTGGLQVAVNQWEEADNFGSLIRPQVTDVREVLDLLRVRRVEQDLFLANAHQQVLKALKQCDYLSPKYHVVVANPPYMGAGGMNPAMKEFVRRDFTIGQSDLYGAFLIRVGELTKTSGFFGMITIPNWMFLSSFADLRSHVLNNWHMTSLIHNGRGMWGSDFGSCAFVIGKSHNDTAIACYVKLFDKQGSVSTPDEIERRFLHRDNTNTFSVSSHGFLPLPGLPFAYWLSEEARRAFDEMPVLGDLAKIGKGLDTGDNERFIRMWHEVNKNTSKWLPCQKGGPFRRWYGNNDFVIDWENDGAKLRAFPKANLRNADYYLKPGLTWTRVSIAAPAFRAFDEGSIFESTGPCIFAAMSHQDRILGFLNSKVATEFLKVFSPTLDFQSGHISSLPFGIDEAHGANEVNERVLELVQLARHDWDSMETSRDFKNLELLSIRDGLLKSTWRQYFVACEERVCRMKELEEANNSTFIAIYRLSENMSPDVATDAVSLWCNSASRYGSDKVESELEALFLADTMREFISYAVGCMFGRYSLDKPGLILANQGESIADYRDQIIEPTFPPDEDNVIPILEGEWFLDDISQRFKDFLKVTFGTEYYNENLEFLENALYPDNPSAKRRKTIRDYFLKDFYDHHLKMYKRRPIYWLFSSPKGTFNAMVYMHRYRPETVGKVLECLRDFREKLAHYSEQRQGIADSASESKAEKTKAVKDVAAIKKQLKELEEYEKSLFGVASRMRNIDIDLDNGVKHNYPLFGSVLSKIPGLNAKED